jgi:hypothetical protein
LGLQYKASSRLLLYTGITIQLFDYATKDGEKGADGINAAYFDGSRSDIIQGSESGFDIGASFTLTDTVSIDFNARTLLNSVFVSASPMVDLFLTFKPGFKTAVSPAATSAPPVVIAEVPSPALQSALSPEPTPAPPVKVPTPVDATAPAIIAQPQSASYVQYAGASALSVTAVSGDSGSLSYRWYRNTRNSNTGGTMIVEATSANFTPPTLIPGTVYYYVIITNKNNSVTGIKIAAVTSGTAAITVTAPVSE